MAELVEFLHYVETSGSSKPPDSIRRLLARNTPDADILELADCERSLIDEVRRTLAAS